MRVEIIDNQGWPTIWESPANTTGHVRGWKAKFGRTGPHQHFALIAYAEKILYHYTHVISVNEQAESPSFDSFIESVTYGELNTNNEMIIDLESLRLGTIEVTNDWIEDHILIDSSCSSEQEFGQFLNYKYDFIYVDGREVWVSDEIMAERLEAEKIDTPHG